MCMHYTFRVKGIFNSADSQLSTKIESIGINNQLNYTISRNTQNFDRVRSVVVFFAQYFRTICCQNKNINRIEEHEPTIILLCNISIRQFDSEAFTQPLSIAFRRFSYMRRYLPHANKNVCAFGLVSKNSYTRISLLT